MTCSPRTVLGIALTVLLVGCRAPADPASAQVAADGTEAMVAASQSTHVAGVVFDSVSVADPASAVTQLATPAQLWPVGCVTSAQDATDPGVVHVSFHDCTGPFGLVHIDGEETATFSAGPNGALHVVIASTTLTANGKPVTQNVYADVTFPSATERSVMWNGSWSRTNDAGEAIAHTSDLQITIDMGDGCVISSGSAETQVDGREVDTSISGYKLCHDPTTGALGCPSGTVTHTGRTSGQTVTVQFDDSDVADVTGPRGNTFPLDLVCTSIGR